MMQADGRSTLRLGAATRRLANAESSKNETAVALIAAATTCSNSTTCRTTSIPDTPSSKNSSFAAHHVIASATPTSSVEREQDLVAKRDSLWKTGERLVDQNATLVRKSLGIVEFSNQLIEPTSRGRFEQRRLANDRW